MNNFTKDIITVILRFLGMFYRWGHEIWPILPWVLWFAISYNGYISSPGFITQESAAEFAANVPTCYGLPYLINATEVASTASPGASICFGYLAR